MKNNGSSNPTDFIRGSVKCKQCGHMVMTLCGKTFHRYNKGYYHKDDNKFDIPKGWKLCPCKSHMGENKNG